MRRKKSALKRRLSSTLSLGAPRGLETKEKFSQKSKMRLPSSEDLNVGKVRTVHEIILLFDFLSMNSVLYYPRLFRCPPKLIVKIVLGVFHPVSYIRVHGMGRPAQAWEDDSRDAAYSPSAEETKGKQRNYL